MDDDTATNEKWLFEDGWIERHLEEAAEYCEFYFAFDHSSSASFLISMPCDLSS